MQALLDVYTIRRELGRLDGFKIAMIGDLANGRTVHSLAYLLSKFDDVEMVFCSPENIQMKPDLKQYLTDVGVSWKEEDSLDAVAESVDVLYQTRIQKERFLVRIHFRQAWCAMLMVAYLNTSYSFERCRRIKHSELMAKHECGTASR